MNIAMIILCPEYVSRKEISDHFRLSIILWFDCFKFNTGLWLDL